MFGLDTEMKNDDCTVEVLSSNPEANNFMIQVTDDLVRRDPHLDLFLTNKE